MKALFIYVNTAARASFPLGLSSLASYVRSKGYEVEIFDTTFYKEFSASKRDHFREKVGFYKKIENPVQIEYIETSMTNDLKQRIKSFSPDIVGVSILSAHYQFSLKLSRFIKKHFPLLPVIFGGLHPTIFPEETISESSIDMICRGEGEYSFTELLDKMSRGEDITGIKGIWVKQNNKIYRNELGRLTAFEDLPVPDWSLFSSQHLYSPLNGRIYRIGPVEFSRGCPYSCAYCSINILRDMVRPQKYLRKKSVDKAIKDLIHLKNKYNIEMFYFLDETFLSVDINSLRDFAREYKKYVGVPFYGLTHPVSVTEEKVALLKEMGCYLMTIGIECGNEEFRRKVLNRPVSNEQIIKAFRAFRKQGIYASAFGMIGLPFETREMVFDTIELFRKCRPQTYAVGIYKPFLGSKLRDICIKKGFFDPAEDTHNYPNTTSVLNMPQLPKEEIEGLYKTFFLYTRVSYENFSLLKKAERDDAFLEKLVMEYREKRVEGSTKKRRVNHRERKFFIKT